MAEVKVIKNAEVDNYIRRHEQSLLRLLVERYYERTLELVREIGHKRNEHHNGNNRTIQTRQTTREIQP
jgi:hypothetical protein